MSEQPPLSILLCGAGGFGESYIPPLLEEAASRNFRLVGAVDPVPERCRLVPELQSRGIPIYHSLDEFYLHHRCDLVVIASPIHVHCELTCVALANGSHVLCEKPLCATVAQADRMEQAEAASGKTVTIGYQWSFSPAIQRLKADILAGRYGAARRLRTLVCWPRGQDYYERNLWAGRQRTAIGEEIFDSPVTNAASHFLHQMFYILGSSVSTSMFPRRVEAELWRANAVENYDTAALQIELENGAKAYFYTSHATVSRLGPSFSYEFENGTIDYSADDGGLEARLSDGTVVDYGSPDAEPRQKLWSAIESARTGKIPVCGIAAARAHVVCAEMAQKSPAGIRDFQSDIIRTQPLLETSQRYVDGLFEALNRGYQQDIEILDHGFRNLFQSLDGPTRIDSTP